MRGTNNIKLYLEGLNCAGCASEIETKAGRAKHVVRASLNYAAGILTISVEEGFGHHNIIADVMAIIKEIEPGVTVRHVKGYRKGNRFNAGRNEGINASEAASNRAVFSEGGTAGNGVGTATGNEAETVTGNGGKTVANEDGAADEGVAVADEGSVAKRIIRAIKHGAVGRESIVLTIGGLLFTAAILFRPHSGIKTVLYLLSYIIAGGSVLASAGKNMVRGRVFDENFLMSISTMGALAIGEYSEAVAVMFFFRVGELLQGLAVDKSKKSIAELIDIQPDYANVKRGDSIVKIHPAEVRAGDILIVKPGEKIPLDGEIIEGVSDVDTSTLTGEAMPRYVEPGSEIFAGFINGKGLLTLKTTRLFEDTAVAKILELVEDAGSRKAPTEHFITKFSRYYTPAVVTAAAVLAFGPPLFIPGEIFAKWLYRALIFLVISCPCALVISIPLGFFGGIGGASRNGILVKGGNYLEALTNVDTVIFDKTGTLTKGVFKVVDTSPARGISSENLLKYAARAEYGSNHPVALSIIKAYGKDPGGDGVESFEEVPGFGVKAIIDGKIMLAGNARLMQRENIKYEPAATAGTVVYMAMDGIFLGSITVADVLKERVPRTIKELKGLNINKIVMLTGDNSKAAEYTACEADIDEVYSELLPDQKVSMVEAFRKGSIAKGKTVFVGDGVNDAPALTAADVGVAMGGLGSDAAIQAADIVIMTDEPEKLISAIKIARRTKAIVWQNIIFALGVKAIVLILGAGGLASMWEAVFADVGVTIIAVLNSMRAMKTNL